MAKPEKGYLPCQCAWQGMTCNMFKIVRVKGWCAKAALKSKRLEPPNVRGARCELVCGVAWLKPSKHRSMPCTAHTHRNTYSACRNTQRNKHGIDKQKHALTCRDTKKTNLL